MEKLEERNASASDLEHSYFLSELQVSHKHFHFDMILRIAEFLGEEFRQGSGEVTFKLVDIKSKAWALIIKLNMRGPVFDIVEWKDAPEIIVQGTKRQYPSVQKKINSSPRSQQVSAFIENATLIDLELLQGKIILHTPGQVISLCKRESGAVEIIANSNR